MSAPVCVAVTAIGEPEPEVIKVLEDLLKKAKTGDVVALAVAYEERASYTGHTAAFGKWANRVLMVGKLQVLATHITLGECLEWKPNG